MAVVWQKGAPVETGRKKVKMLYLVKIFEELTDEEHGLTLAQIQEKLLDYGVNADRKILYDDFNLLRDFGYDIVKARTGNEARYYLGSRDFELAELKMLVDVVQSAKFITERKSNKLIRKLERLASNYDARKLQRFVTVTGRVKTMNESIFYNIDKLHEAISEKRKIKFRYFNWTPEKKAQLRHDGAFYKVSPYYLIWDDENYYLVAYDSAAAKIKHYRVDKMMNIQMINERREGQSALESLDLSAYDKKTFGMFGGENTAVHLRCEDRMAGVMIDRFGKEVSIIPGKDGYFDLYTEVAMSDQFLGWLISLGEGVTLEGPESARQKLGEIGQALEKYYLHQEN